MPFDPAWDMPQINWQQQGAYRQGSVPPIVEPYAGTQVYLGPVAREWKLWICGALDILRNPSNWIVANDDAMYDVLRRVDTLLGLLCGNGGSPLQTMIRLQDCILQTSTDGGSTWTDVPGWTEHFGDCVRNNIPPPVPVLPPGQSTNQQACNLAGYLATEILKKVVQDSVTSFQNNLNLLEAANSIMQELGFVFPLSAAFVSVVTDLYALYTQYGIAAFQAALGDPTLWSDLTCAIFQAIRDVGHITASNLPALISNVCGLSYSSAVVVTGLCEFVTNIGLANLQAMQVFGALDVVDCSGCAHFCYEWFWNTNNAFTINYGTWISGTGYSALNCSFPTCAATCNLLELTGTVNTAIPVTDVYLHCAHSAAWSSPSVIPRQIALYFSGGLAHTVVLDASAFATGAWFHAVIPDVLTDTFNVEWPENFGAVGAVLDRFAIKYRGSSDPFSGASPCTDLPAGF